MAFAIRHKETGEMWLGSNYRNPKLYSTAAHAKSALSNSNQGPQVLYGLTPAEYHGMLHELLRDLKKQREDAAENYRRAQYDYPKDRERRELAQREYHLASQDYHRAEKKARENIRTSYLKWEVIEI